jgi:hypothetical protein
MKKERHKIVRELVRILLRDEYLDFLLVYKKVPMWCVDIEGKEYNIIKNVDGIDLDGGLYMASELSLCLRLVIIDKDIDLDKTVWLLGQYNKCLDVYKDPRYNTFIVNYQEIHSQLLHDFYAARDVIEDLLFSLLAFSSYPVSIVPVK